MATTKDSFDKKDENFKKSPKRKLSFGWVIGMMVLILIGISFVLAPALGALAKTSMGGNELVFGSYSDEKITYAMDNYFYDQVQSIGKNAKANNSNQKQQAYQVWQQAFNNTVIYTALTQQARAAGIKNTEQIVNKTIINSGIFSNSDGKFDIELYKKTSDAYKSNLIRSTRRDLPFQTVLSDYSKVFSGKKELAFIDNLAKDQRKFSFVEFTKDLYPKEHILNYAASKQNIFSERELNVLLISDKAKAQDAENKIKNGESFESVATEINKDVETNLGYLSQYQIVEMTSEDDANKIFATATNELAPLTKLTNGSYILVQPISDVRLLDLKLDDNYNKVKAYFMKNKSDLVQSYLKEKAKELALANNNNLEAIAAVINSEVKKTDPTSLNIGNTGLYPSLNGDLASATNDAKLELFKADVDSITSPIVTSSTTVILAKASNVEGDTVQLNNFYPYYTRSITQNDLAKSIINSDKLKNDFLNVFFKRIISKS